MKTNVGAIMSKRLGISPKNVERRMLSRVELQKELRQAVPPMPLEPLKNYYPRAAEELGWSTRRVRAWWNGEARRIDHLEMVTIAQLKNQAQENEKRIEGLRDEIATLRAQAGHGSAGRSGANPGAGRGDAGAGEQAEEEGRREGGASEGAAADAALGRR
jgi:uncharacterized small protein (DUF1192 family)